MWLSVFLLPWQLRHTVMFASISGEYFEYGSWHIYATDLAIVALLLIWLIRPRGRFTLGPKWLNLPLLTWLMWLTLSITWATDRPLAAVTIAHWWLAYGWYLYLVNRVRDVGQIVTPLAWGIGLQAVWGIAQYLLNHSVGLNWLGESVLDPQVLGIPVVIADGIRQLRAHGMLPHANMLGGVLVTSIPVLIYWYGRTERPRRRWLALVILVSVGVVGLSFARSAWLVLAVGLVVIALVAWRVQSGLGGVVIFWPDSCHAVSIHARSARSDREFGAAFGHGTDRRRDPLGGDRRAVHGAGSRRGELYCRVAGCR